MGVALRNLSDQHSGARGDIPKGTLRAIQRQLEACLGKDWWKNG
jgi:hypothetical protein